MRYEDSIHRGEEEVAGEGRGRDRSSCHVQLSSEEWVQGHQGLTACCVIT